MLRIMPGSFSPPNMRPFHLSFAIGCCILSTTLFAGELPEPGQAFQIEDGGVLRTFTVSGRAISIKAAQGSPRAIDLPAPGQSLREQFRLARLQNPAAAEINLALTEPSAKARQGKPAAPRLLTCLVLVKLPPDGDAETLAAEVGASSVESPVYAPGLHIFHCPDQGGALALMERLRARPEVLSANAMLTRPIVRKIPYTPNDPLYANAAANDGYCWHLKNTGVRGGTTAVSLNVNTPGCWDLYRGSGIVIGVVDDGVEITHPDLAANYLASASYDFLDHDADPSPGTTDDHGTCVAGLAAARGNNGVGVCGVAPEAKFAGLRIGLDSIDDLQISNAFAYQNNVIAIKTNSWGPDDSGFSLEAPSALTSAALQDGITNGRGGLGTIFLFAGGNGADAGDNSNYDGFANSIYTIAISAVSDNGTPTYYAEPGANLIASAGGNNDDDQGLTSTDRSGAAGYNNGTSNFDYTNTAYTNSFGGTSGATPQAAGVVALMLQAKPTLGWRDVQEILIASATQNHATDNDWTTNAAGYHFNHKYGAGLIEATSAVTKASTWTPLGPQTSVTLGQEFLAAPIPDAPNTAGLTTSFNFTSQPILRVEHVTVYLNAAIARRGDLEVRLTSPSGMTSVLAERHDDDTPNYDWTFTSVRHWGENSAGTWKVTVVDRNANNAGILNAVRVKLHGTASTASAGVPVVTSNAAAAAIKGAPFSFQITATKSPTTFNATALPAGLTINTATGIISGIPTTTANTNISLTATNASGTSVAKILALTTTAPSALAEAVDYLKATWETDGDALWAKTTTASSTQDGIDAAKSLSLPAGGYSYFKAFVQGPALVSFYWKYNTETFSDYAYFYIDSEEIHSFDGVSGFVKYTEMIPSGRHTLRWEMYRDPSSSTSTSNTIVDQVVVADPATIAPMIITHPHNRVPLLGGKTCFWVEAIGQPPLTYQWKRSGVVIPNSNSARILVEPVEFLPTDTSANVEFSCTVSNALNTVGVISSSAYLTPEIAIDGITAGAPARAVDNPSLYLASGNTWLPNTAITHDGVDSLRAQAIGYPGSALLETCIIGPAKLNFFWKLKSSNNNDYLHFIFDDREYDTLQGEKDWRPSFITIPPGPHVFNWKHARASNNTAYDDAAFLDQVQVVPESYASWQSHYFSPTQRAASGTVGPMDDPEHDGVINLMEYALGLDPNVRNPSLPPAVIRSGNTLEYTFPRNFALTDIAYTPETAASLSGAWTPVAALDTTGTGDIRIMKVSLPMNGSHLFVRLRISKP